MIHRIGHREPGDEGLEAIYQQEDERRETRTTRGYAWYRRIPGELWWRI
jgi:hypothetical protein